MSEEELRLTDKEIDRIYMGAPIGKRGLVENIKDIMRFTCERQLTKAKPLIQQHTKQEIMKSYPIKIALLETTVSYIEEATESLRVMIEALKADQASGKV